MADISIPLLNKGLLGFQFLPVLFLATIDRLIGKILSSKTENIAKRIIVYYFIGTACA